MSISKLVEGDGTTSLQFECGDLPADQAIEEAGHEPTGYFWEGVAVFVADEIVADLELDSEEDRFAAYGKRDRCEALQRTLEPLLGDADAMADLIERADADGYTFDD